jgi:hypothetical protein
MKGGSGKISKSKSQVRVGMKDVGKDGKMLRFELWGRWNGTCSGSYLLLYQYISLKQL